MLILVRIPPQNVSQVQCLLGRKSLWRGMDCKDEEGPLDLHILLIVPLLLERGGQGQLASHSPIQEVTQVKDAGQEVYPPLLGEEGALVHQKWFTALHLGNLLLLLGDVHSVALLLHQGVDHLILGEDHHPDHVVGLHLLFVIECVLLCVADHALLFGVDQGRPSGVGQGHQLDDLLLEVGLGRLQDIDHHL